MSKLIGSGILFIALTSPAHGQVKAKHAGKGPGGDAKAQVSMALALQEPGRRDLVRSESLLRTAANAGNVEAERFLGRFLHLVDGARKDYPEAWSWYEKAAAHGDLWAINNLGVMCHQGLSGGIQGRSGAQEALPFYRKAAEGGFPMAQYNLAYCYYEGRGLNRDYREAERWFLKSAEGGYSEAMVQLSYMYLQGEGARKDGAQAVFWAKRAADLGNASGSFNLGRYYDGWEGVPSDYREAEKRYLEAARLGDVDAMHNLGFMYGEGELGAPDYQKARYWYEQAVSRGEISSLLNLGTLYFEGLGVPKDPKKGADYVFWGAYAGDPGAQGRLGYMYYMAEGVQKDWVNGLAWSLLAEEGGDANGAKNVREGSARMNIADRAKAQQQLLNIKKEILRRHILGKSSKGLSRGANSTVG